MTTGVDMPVHAELAALEQRVERYARRPAEIDAERREASAAVQRAKMELQDYFASVERGGKADKAKEARLTKAVAEAQSALHDHQWDVEIAGARTAHAMARQDVDVFVREQLEDLVAELTLKSEALNGELLARVDAVVEAHAAWAAVAGEWGRYADLLPGGRLNNRIPGDRIQVDDAVRGLKRVVQAEAIVPPLPLSLRPAAVTA